MDPAAAMDLQYSSRMLAVREIEAKGDSEIQQLFAGSVVFVTGGTGFLGKQLLEKLLRACHGIKKIYLLTRSKKGKTLEQRLAKTYKDPVFNQLRKINPEFENLIFPVEGDISKLKLGIKHEDWEKITQEVNFIYHVAATVLFNEPMKSAIIANVRGTREVIALARDCRNLKSIVHVSTAFSHCYREKVAEKFYPSPVPPATMIEMVESMEDSRLDAMTPALTEGWPNTYTFSKAIGEELVRVMGEGLPICVVRPAIVVPSHREPEPGWLDVSNVLGPTAIPLGIFIGALRIVLANVDCRPDLVPVDYVNNLIIATSWETARKFQSGDQDIKVYTCSKIRNRIRVGQCKRFVLKECQNYVSPKTISYSACFYSGNKNIFSFLSPILHSIPALFVDGALMTAGKNFRISTIYQKYYTLLTLSRLFLIKTWDFYDDNTLDLCNNLSKADKQIFHFDVANIEHMHFMIIWILGLRKYIIKDGLTGTEKAVKRQPIMRIVHYIVSTLYFFFLWKVLYWTGTATKYCTSSVLKFMRYYLSQLGNTKWCF